MKQSVEATVSLNQLIPWGENPRKHRANEAITQMIASLKANGQFQPLLAVETENNLYHVVEGETRRLAFQMMVATNDIPDDHPIRVWILPNTLTHSELLNIALAGNTVRRSLDPLDECDAFAGLLKTGMTEAQVADAYALSRGVVRQRLALSRLIPAAKDMVRKNIRNLGWAQAMTLGNEADQQRICDNIATNNASYMDSNAVKMELNRTRIPLANALFDPSILCDSISRDLFDTDSDHFTDKDAFWKAQQDAIDSKIEELGNTHNAVHVIDRADFNDIGWTRGGEPASSTAVLIIKDDGSVEILEGMIPPAEAEESLDQNAQDFIDNVDIEDTLGDTSTASTGARIRRALDKPAPSTSQYLSAQIAAGLKVNVASNERLAKIIVVASALTNAKTGIIIEPDNITLSREQRTSDVFHAFNNRRSSRDVIITKIFPSGIKKLNFEEVVETLTSLTNSDLDAVFSWSVADAMTAGMDQRTTSMSVALGVMPMTGWRIEQAYLDSLTTPQIRELAAEFAPSQAAYCATAKRSKLEDIIMTAVNTAIANDDIDSPIMNWLPPQIEDLFNSNSIINKTLPNTNSNNQDNVVLEISDLSNDDDIIEDKNINDDPFSSNFSKQITENKIAQEQEDDYPFSTAAE